jgi:predicted helicase
MNIFYEHSQNEKLNYLQTVKIDSSTYTNQTPASLGPWLNKTERLFDPFFSTPNRTIVK